MVRINRQMPLVCALLIALGSVVGCNRNEPQAVDQSAQPAAELRGDRWITTSIQARYQADDNLRTGNIDVTTENGVVTLRGHVPSESAQQQALSIARTIEGVARVNDELSVQAADATATPGSRPADGLSAIAGPDANEARGLPAASWITTKIQAQYFVNPEIKPWNIDVTTTSDGIVTLQGEVEEHADKAAAVRIARATEGVTQVEDQLRVLGEGEQTPQGTSGETMSVNRPDMWLTAKVQAKYFMDDEVKGRDINVETQNGVVTLKGTVESEAERRQAVALARSTDGVREVHDQLEVQPAAEEATGTAGGGAEQDRRSTGVTVDDTWITTKIQSKYFLDPDVKGHDVNVDAQNGVVTLSGAVESERQKQVALDIARQTEGVARVVDKLSVTQGRK